MELYYYTVCGSKKRPCYKNFYSNKSNSFTWDFQQLRRRKFATDRQTDQVLSDIMQVCVNSATFPFNALFSSEHASVTSV